MDAINAASRFKLDATIVSCERYGHGHINETYLVTTQSGARYILQRINDTVFTNPKALMENIIAVTDYLRANGEDPRSTLRTVDTREGERWLNSGKGDCWRVYDFVTDSICLDAAENAEDFYQSAVAFGRFQAQLKDYPSEQLHETIPHFHDTPDRYRQLREAIAKNKAGRRDEVAEEIAFALAHEVEAGTLLEAGLPLRVTHNDTKLNNVMLDAQTREPLCVIDLDTVMPGLAAYDFGDSIRFGASTAAEDETDLSKVEMSLALFETYAKGFLSACGKELTDAEIALLPMGAKLMTLECGIRFLADYLNGDIYFHTAYPGHNLDRCRTQFKLVADMEAKWDDMCAVIAKLHEIQ